MTNVVAHNPAQLAAPLDLLSLFSPNQRVLVSGLFRTEAARPRVTRPAAVYDAVLRQIARRCIQNLGESEGVAYADSLNVLQSHKDAARAHAAACLVRAGKAVAQ